MLNLNFSSVQDREPLNEGIYSMVIDKVEEKTSKTGKQMLVVQLVEPETKSRIFENFVLQENCLWRLRDLFKAAGYETDQDLVGFDEQELVGLAVNVKVVQEEYNDQIVNRVSKYIVG